MTAAIHSTCETVPNVSVASQTHLREALLPCPFCGGVVETYQQTSKVPDNWVVRCDVCGAQCGPSASSTAARYNWNTRPALLASLSATAAGDADVVGDLRRMYQLGQTYWQQADSDWTSQHRKADVTDKAAKDIIAKYAAKGALPMASRAEIPKTPDWEEIDTLLASAAVGQAYSEERRICAIRDHLKSWLYALETERLLTKPHAPSPACVNAISAKESK